MIMLGQFYELKDPGQALELGIIAFLIKNKRIFFLTEFCDFSRAEGAFSLLLCIAPVVDLQAGFSSTCRRISDHRQWVGLCSTHGSDAAGTRPAPAPHASW